MSNQNIYTAVKTINENLPNKKSVVVLMNLWLNEAFCTNGTNKSKTTKQSSVRKIDLENLKIWQHALDVFSQQFIILQYKITFKKNI